MCCAATAGFDAQDEAVPTQAIGIHHPHGNVKRISYVNNTCAHASARHSKETHPLKRLQ